MVGAIEFVVVVLVLYTIECFVKLNPKDLLFQTGWSSRYRARKPFLYPSNGNWGWLILDPFRPTAVAFLSPSRSMPPPLVSAAEQEQERTWLSAKIAHSLDVQGLQRTVDHFLLETKTLRAVVTANCLSTLVLFPIMVAIVGLRAAILPAAVIAILLSVVTAAVFAKIWDDFYSDKSPTDKWGAVIKMVLYPVSSLRCIEALSLPLLNEWHRVAVAYQLCDLETARKIARTILAELLYGSGEEDDTNRVVLNEIRELERVAVVRFLTVKGVSVEELMCPPELSDSLCKSYCPKCMAQFVHSSGVCSDCGNVVLQTIPKRYSDHGVGKGEE